MSKDFSLIAKKSTDGTGSKFLDALYNDPARYQKFKTVVEEMHAEMEAKKLTEGLFTQYTLPLGFPKPMLLSSGEERAIRQAVMEMAQSVNEGKYIIRDKFSIVHFDVSDHDQTDMPMPYIKMSVRGPAEIVPKRGFYLSGIFKKEKRCREIVKAKIDKITFYTEDMKKFVLATF